MLFSQRSLFRNNILRTKENERQLSTLLRKIFSRYILNVNIAVVIFIYNESFLCHLINMSTLVTVVRNLDNRGIISLMSIVTLKQETFRHQNLLFKEICHENILSSTLTA